MSFAFVLPVRIGKDRSAIVGTACHNIFGKGWHEAGRFTLRIGDGYRVRSRISASFPGSKLSR